MKKENIINIKEIINAGGATLSPDGEPVQLKSGYQVSKKDCYILKIKYLNKIYKCINKALKGLKRGEFLGLWVDAGAVYIDISERVKSLKKAIAYGKSRKQKSIYEWRTGACLPCVL
jgi:hypothetical protein